MDKVEGKFEDETKASVGALQFVLELPVTGSFTSSTQAVLLMKKGIDFNNFIARAREQIAETNVA